VADAFRDQGWNVSEDPGSGDVGLDLVAWGHGKKLVLEIKRASEGRKDRVIPLLSQAALNVAYQSRRIPGHPIPVAIVGANRISESVAEEATEFVRERVPEVAVGLLDWEGFRSFAGHGLESLSSPRRAESSARGPKARPPQLFSDLNQWMLKVVMAPGIPEEYLSAPRRQYQGASPLAEAAGVSVMSAFRFVAELSKEGFLDSGLGVLRLVRLKELMNRWAAASQQLGASSGERRACKRAPFIPGTRDGRGASSAGGTSAAFVPRAVRGRGRTGRGVRARCETASLCRAFKRRSLEGTGPFRKGAGRISRPLHTHSWQS